MLEMLGIIVLLPFAVAIVTGLVTLAGIAIGFIALPFAWAAHNEIVWLLVALFGVYAVIHSMIVSWP
jgi:hypothetical protein